MYLKVKSYGNGKPILYGLNSMRAPFGCMMRAEDVQANAQGRKVISEGQFVVEVNGTTRFLARSRGIGTFSSNTMATATNANTVRVATPNASFKVEDVLYAVGCYAEVTFGGTITAGDVLTVQINNINYSVTAPASPTPASVATAWITANDTALRAVGVIATAKGGAGTVALFATNSWKIDTFSSNGSATITRQSTDVGYFGDHVMPLGKVQTVGTPATDQSRTLILAGNAAYAVPAGVPIGTKVNMHLGIYPEPLDFTDEPLMHLAPIAQADGVYERNLPYIDEQLKRVYSDLNIKKYFYRA